MERGLRVMVSKGACVTIVDDKHSRENQCHFSGLTQHGGEIPARFFGSDAVRPRPRAQEGQRKPDPRPKKPRPQPPGSAREKQNVKEKGINLCVCVCLGGRGG